MRRQIWMCGTVVAGVATLASVSGYADDKKADALPGPINSLSDLQDTAKLVFKLADTNNDDQISQKEAIDAGNLLVGGFFFRADANGDGVSLTAQEAQQARETLYTQQPLLRFVVERAKTTNPTPGNQPQNVQPIVGGTTNDPARVVQSLTADPMGTIGNLLDTNRDQKIEASELRQAVQTGVQTLFLVADTNQDGQLSPYELNAAVAEVAKSTVQTAFQAADGDRNGMLSIDEYDKALTEPHMRSFACSMRTVTTSSLLPSCNEPSKSSPTRFNGFKFPNRLTLCRIRFSVGGIEMLSISQFKLPQVLRRPARLCGAPLIDCFTRDSPGLLARDLL